MEGEQRSGGRRRPPHNDLSTAGFVAAVNRRRPNRTLPLTLRTLQRCIAAGEVKAHRPGKRRWRIPDTEIARFVREHNWRPEED